MPIELAVRQHVDAFLIGPDGLTQMHQQTIVDLVARHWLPAAYPAREFVKAGGLTAYAGGRRSALLGSVSEGLLLHSPVQVTVVHMVERGVADEVDEAPIDSWLSRPADLRPNRAGAEGRAEGGPSMQVLDLSP